MEIRCSLSLKLVGPPDTSYSDPRRSALNTSTVKHVQSSYFFLTIVEFSLEKLLKSRIYLPCVLRNDGCGVLTIITCVLRNGGCGVLTIIFILIITGIRGREGVGVGSDGISFPLYLCSGD